MRSVERIARTESGAMRTGTPLCDATVDPMRSAAYSDALLAGVTTAS
jgi:hypothetical protein